MTDYAAPQELAETPRYYCADCENHTPRLVNDRCPCGSGRAIATMTTDHASLRLAAQRATPGPWKVYDGCSWRRIGVDHSRFDDCAVLAPYVASDGHPDLTASRGNDLYANLNYIAAANPSTIIELLDRIEALEKALEPLSNAVFNDNGDLTVSIPHVTAEQCQSAYFAAKAARATLTTGDSDAE